MVLHDGAVVDLAPPRLLRGKRAASLCIAILAGARGGT
jgi:hypothetical protein